MNIKAIVYKSNTGHTKEYAEILSEKMKIPCCKLGEENKIISKGDSIIYMGWLMAGTIKGYKEAAGKYKIEAVCPVGMVGEKAQLENIVKTNKLGNLPTFILKGGIEIEKLKGIHKATIKVVIAGVSKGLSEKEHRTPEEEEVLDIVLNGGSRVSADQLEDIMAWYNRVIE